jgi:hypothetical protein
MRLVCHPAGIPGCACPAKRVGFPPRRLWRGAAPGSKRAAQVSPLRASGSTPPPLTSSAAARACGAHTRKDAPPPSASACSVRPMAAAAASAGAGRSASCAVAWRPQKQETYHRCSTAACSFSVPAAQACSPNMGAVRLLQAAQACRPPTGAVRLLQAAAHFFRRARRPQDLVLGRLQHPLQA